jgi:hypothetical protein
VTAVLFQRWTGEVRDSEWLRERRGDLVLVASAGCVAIVVGWIVGSS